MKMRESLIERQKKGITNHPSDLSTEALVENYKIYSSLQSKGVRDEIYLSLLESELEHRKQYSFNARIIAELLH